MKQSLLLVMLIGLLALGCTKENVTTTQNDSQLTARAYQPYNCSTDTTQAAYIQLIDPLSPKSWLASGSFCFTTPTQTIPNPIIYTNGDSLPVTLQIFVNRVFIGPSLKWVTEKVDEFSYYPVFHPYPTPFTVFPQKPALQQGTFTFPINFKFEKKGLYNGFINQPFTYTYDTVAFNYDAYDFGMHSATTNGYAYVRLVIKSDKPH